MSVCMYIYVSIILKTAFVSLNYKHLFLFKSVNFHKKLKILDI